MDKYDQSRVKGVYTIVHVSNTGFQFKYKGLNLITVEANLLYKAL